MILNDDIIKKHGLMFAAVYAVISSNPSITQAEIAKLCHTSLRTVQRTIEALQKINYIEIRANKPHPNTYEILYRPKSQSSSSKKAFGEFGHVLISDHEYQKLVGDFNGDTDLVNEYITKLDDYLEIHPEKHYAAHHRLIHNWINDNKKNQRKRIIPPKGAKYWFGGKTYGDLINDEPNIENRRYYLQMLDEKERNELATMPLEDRARMNEYLIFVNKFEEGE